VINFLRRNETLTILCIQVALVMLGLGLVSPILPQYGQSFGVSITMVGFIITIYGIARIIVDIPTANLTEKLGRRPILITGPLIQAVGSVACGLAGSYWQLIIFRFIQGVGSAALTTSAMIMLADISSSENRGRIMSFYQGSMLLGSGLGPTLGGFVAQYFGLRAPFFALATLSLVSTVWAYLRIPETRQVLEQQAAPQNKNDINPSSGTSATGLKALLQNLNFMTISIVSFALFFMRTGSRSELLPLLASDRLGLSSGQIGIAMTMISVFNFLILFVCGTLSDRFGRKILITPGVILSAASIAMLSLAGSYWFLILTCIIWGIGTGISGPLPAAYVADVIPRGSYSYGMGLYRAIGDLGFVTGPIILGWIADIKGYNFALWFNSLFLLLAIIIFQLLAKEPSRTRRQPAEIVST
jgi:DHA1 family multidrug resistance protein-like MFS transporter